MRGIFHAHTTYSHDGKCTVAELAGLCRGRGLGFAAICEHAQDLDAGRMRALVEECGALGGPQGVILSPGLEFGFREYPHLHLLGVGLREYIAPMDISDTIGEIHRQGGLAVIAHPTRNGHFVPDHVKGVIDGVEVWNAAYDSRYLPHHRSMRLLNELRARNSSALAFGGLDMHRARDFKDLVLTVDGSPADASGLLGLLREGSFTVSGRFMRIGARQPVRALAVAGVMAARAALEGADGLVALARGRMGRASR